MKPYVWKLLLAASLLVNVGVLASALLQGWRANGASERALFGMRHEQLADRLGLDAAQRAHWHEMEADFVKSLRDSGQQIRLHRERMVRQLMSDQPDLAAIERERDAIFALQQAQQRAVIAQLLKERELLRPEQRARLAEILLAQDTGTPAGR
jgi:Spy/CpxP family protein refolding chaperone